MRRKILLLVALFGVCLFSVKAQNVLQVNESEIEAVLLEKTAEISLKIDNPNNEVRGNLNLELLDVDGKIRAQTAQNLALKNGKQTVEIVLSLGDLMQKAQDEIAWFRLRYSIKDANNNIQSAGIVSISEIIKDIFDLRVAAGENIFAGMNYRARVRAIHPISNAPVKNIKIKGELTLDVENEETDELKITAKGETNAEGFAFLEFKIPADAQIEDDGEIKITGEKYGIVREIEEDLDTLADQSGLYINTDKPLYQPGQMLNVRGILLRGMNEGLTVIADTELEFEIEDEDETVLFRQKVKTSGFGIAAISWQIPENAKLGTYRITVETEDGDDVGSETVKISRYELPNFVVSTKTDKPFYLPTDATAEVEIRADYLFGKAIEKGKIRIVQEGKRAWNYEAQKYDVQEERTFEGASDTSGKFTAKIDLSATHKELAGKSYRRYEDLNFAAYFTDLTTNRTEQRRFDLRVTKEAIHVYFVGETYNQNPNLPANYYVSTFYADGTPAPATVSISGKYENENDFKPLATLKTNSFGAGKFEFLAPKKSNFQFDFELKLLATDAKMQSGTFSEEIDFDDDAALQIRTEKTIYKQGEAVKTEILSNVKDAFVYVDLVRDYSVIESRFVQMKDGRAEVKFAFQPRFQGELTISAYFEKLTKPDEDDDYYYSSLVKDSHGIIFPKAQNLQLEAKFSKETYRPNEEAKLNFSVLAPDKTPLESALGIVIFDKAIEERARTDAEFGGNSRGMFERFYGLLGLNQSFGGITLNDLNELDTRKPISADLQLAAEVMLAENEYSPRIYYTGESAPQARGIFSEYFDKLLTPTETALTNAYTKDFSRPADIESLRRILLENKIDFDALRDPWDNKFLVKFAIEETDDTLNIQSAGADKKFDTKDDFTVLKMNFSYFLPFGKTIDEAATKHFEMTGEYVRNYETLREALRRKNVELDKLKDRWNNPYRVEFGINQNKYTIKFHSNGANGADEETDYNTDDFEAWTSEIDYFAATDAKISDIFKRYAEKRESYPKSEAEFKEMLKADGVDFDLMKDAYGQNLYVNLTTYSRQSYTNTDGKYQSITQKIIVFKLRSNGADAVSGSADDFNLAIYSGEIDETDENPKTSAVKSGTNGAIRGTVTDPSGAVVPGATITATNKETEEDFFATTDDEGKFLVENLPSGNYEVRAEYLGFQKSVRNNITVKAGAITQIDFTLEVGTTSAMVSVDSDGVATVEKASTISGRGSGQGDGIGDGMGSGDGDNEKDVSKNRAQNSTPRLREYFPETLVWNPELITDKTGKALIKFRLADNLTTWKLYAIASDKQGRIGVTSKEIKTFQPFFVDLDPPKFLTETDEIFLPVQIRNYTAVRQKVGVSMKPENWFSFITAETRTLVSVPNSQTQKIEVAANQTQNAIFGFKAISPIKDGKQRVTAIAEKDSDAIEKPVTVRPNGQEIVRTDTKVFDKSGNFTAGFPSNALPKTQKSELKIYPNLMAHVTESVEGLLQRPYGCGEQTISSTYPNLMILKFTKTDNALTQKARKYLQKGYERLLGYQVLSGGFSYWGGKDSADIALTAYALRFFTDAKEFIETDKDVIENARQFLIRQQREDGSWTKQYTWETTEDKTRTTLFTAYVARILAMTKDADKEVLQKALNYLRGAEISEPYALALYGLANFDSGNIEEARIVAKKLKSMAKIENGTAYWNLETSTPFYGWGMTGKLETTALAVQLLEKIDWGSDRRSGEIIYSELREKAMLFLLKNKDRYGVWYSTQTTINVLDTFLALLSTSKEQAVISISVNGEKLKDFAVSADQIEPIILDLSDKLSSANRLEITSSNSSTLIAQIVSTHYIDWANADLSSKSLRLDYQCDKQSVAIMEEIICAVETQSVRGYGMLLAEIGLPPGADVSRESMEKALQENWNLSRYEILPDRIVLYLWSKPNATRFNFKFRPRYGIKAQTPASIVYDYYNPEAQATVAPLRFEVSSE